MKKNYSIEEVFEEFEEVVDEVNIFDYIEEWILINGIRDLGYEFDYYYMDEFDELMNVEPSEIARSIYYGGHFFPLDEYFRFNGYGNVVSVDKYEFKEALGDQVDELKYDIVDIMSRYYKEDLGSYIGAIEEELQEYLEDEEVYIEW